jgi:hypothetical protein
LKEEGTKRLVKVEKTAYKDAEYLDLDDVVLLLLSLCNGAQDPRILQTHGKRCCIKSATPALVTRPLEAAAA